MMSTNGNGNGNGNKYSKQGIAGLLLELFSTPGRWNMGPYAKDVGGKSVCSSDPSAISWCSAGAIFKLRDEAKLRPEHAAIDEFIPYWNRKAIALTGMDYVSVNEKLGLPEVRRVLEAIKAEA
jgi:hypothetical protein